MKEITIKPGKDGLKIGDTTFTGEGGIVIGYGSGDEEVAVRDYAASKGFGNQVDWDGTGPTIGGVKINPTHVKDGTAYVSREDADRAISEMMERSGVLGQSAPRTMREDKYGNYEKDALMELVERKPFLYDPETDVVFKSYEKKQRENAEDAYRRVLNDNNASVTTASSAVLSEAMAAQYNELAKIAEAIPDFYMDAYERYTDENEMDKETLETITGIADSYYDKLYTENSDAYKNLTDAGETERRDEQRWIDNDRNAVNDGYENRMRAAETTQTNLENSVFYDKTEAELWENQVDGEEKAMDNAIKRGFFIEQDEHFLPWLAEFRTEKGYSISPTLALVAYQYDVSHERERAKINAKMGR